MSVPEMMRKEPLDITIPPSGSVKVLGTSPGKPHDNTGGDVIGIGIQPPTSLQNVPIGQHPSKQQKVPFWVS
jgi:hypothetical protein